MLHRCGAHKHLYESFTARTQCPSNSSLQNCSQTHVSSSTLKTNYNLPLIYYHLIVLVEYVVLLFTCISLKSVFAQCSSTQNGYLLPLRASSLLAFHLRSWFSLLGRATTFRKIPTHGALHYNKLLSPAVRGWRGRR